MLERYRGSGNFNADHLIDGDITLTIREILFNEEMSGGGKKDVVTFDEDGRRLVLNQTTARQIAKVAGADSDQWPGKQITLYRDETVEFQGRPSPGIRVRVPGEAGAPKGNSGTAQRRPQPPRPQSPPPPEMDDPKSMSSPIGGGYLQP
jgi:hypothetical protein